MTGAGKVVMADNCSQPNAMKQAPSLHLALITRRHLNFSARTVPSTTSPGDHDRIFGTGSHVLCIFKRVGFARDDSQTCKALLAALRKAHKFGPAICILAVLITLALGDFL